MNLVLFVPVALLLVAVAAAGVVAPLGVRRPPVLQPPADPLEDRRLALLLSLRDLEESRAAGTLEDGEYARLREETEGRIARVLRALDARRAAPRSAEAAGDGGRGGPSRPSGPRWVSGLLVGTTVLVVTVPSLLSSVADRPPGGIITGDLAGGRAPADPLAFFEARVRAYPRDVAARLDLAHRYLDAGRVGDASEQYLAALRLDRDNAEAHAHLGLVLFTAGRPELGLEEVERALEVEPRYPEALFFKGLILLQGLSRPRAAADALEAYLDLAPFGADREQARRLLEEAEARAGAP
ncbi:MAG: tetratricopeptide repeat protein [Actinomycetota bacterium]